MTTSFNSINYQSILTQAKSEVSQILGLNGDFELNNYMNSIFTAAGDADAIVNGDETQKANAIQNIVMKLTDLLSNLGTKDEAKAIKKTNNSNKAIDNNAQEAETINQTVDEKLQEILEQCAAGAVNIQNALEKIQELGGDNGKITEAQAKLEEQVAIIEKNKQILNDGVSEPGKKKEALIAILGAASVINNLVNEVNQYKSIIDEQNAKVEEATENIAELQTGATEILQEGISDLQQNAAKNQQLAVQDSQMSVESVQENVVGTQQVAIGTAMESGLQAAITGATGTKYILSGNDKIAAGATLMKGAVSDLANLAQSNAALGGYASNFVNFVGGINEFAEGVEQLVGNYDSTVNNVISSIGSWEQYSTANDSLQSYVQQYMEDSNSDNYEMSPLQNDSFVQPQNQSQKYQSDLEKKDAKDINFKKFEFDTQVFSASSPF